MTALFIITTIVIAVPLLRMLGKFLRNEELDEINQERLIPFNDGTNTAPSKSTPRPNGDKSNAAQASANPR